MNSKELVIQRFKDSIAVKEQNINDAELVSTVAQIAETLTEVLRRGNKLVICGNGGSASDALHFAGEIVGRFQLERPSWPAVVLNADVATMTAIANDYSYEDVFARQAQGHVMPGDMFIGISTSGNSENVLRAALVAKKGRRDCRFPRQRRRQDQGYSGLSRDRPLQYDRKGAGKPYQHHPYYL